jgi:hypothetical protein
METGVGCAVSKSMGIHGLDERLKTTSPSGHGERSNSGALRGYFHDFSTGSRTNGGVVAKMFASRHLCKEAPMRIDSTKPLFAWECLDDSPSLATVREFLTAIPDGKLLESLHRARGKGRDDYPVRVLWGVLLLATALRHPTIEACLAELRRNSGLRRLIGIESEDQVPKKWNMSRFQDVLGQEPHATHLKAIFSTIIQRLGSVVPDLGRNTAGDATGLSARRKDETGAQAEVAAGLPQASGGRKEYTDDAGNVTEVVEWFGFKLHLLVDAKHEVALSYEITDTKAGDGETLPTVLAQAQQNLPRGRIKTLAYDMTG